MPAQSQRPDDILPGGNSDVAGHDGSLHVGDDGQRPLDILLNAIANSSGYDLGANTRERVGPDGENDLTGQVSQEGDGTASRQSEDQINLAELLSGEPDLQSHLLGPRPATPIWDQYAVQQAISGYLSTRGRSGQSHSRAVDENGAELAGPSASTVQLWHPMTAQKSYGRERRILNPAPILRATGPVASVVTSLTLSTVKDSAPSSTEPEPTPLSSHTQHIPYSETEANHSDIEPSFGRDAESSRDAYFQRVQGSYQSHGQYSQAAAGRTAKQLRDEDRRKMREIALKNGFGASLPRFRKFNLSKEREALADGITFPSLYVGQEVGKSKSFHLQLGIGIAGASAPSHAVMSAESGMVAELPRTGHPPGQQGSPATFDTMGYPSEAKADPQTAATTTSSDAHSPAHWAKLLSGPLSIVSKPSQKTAKARTMTTCFTVDASFSLCVRINSQTVRTKYMKLDADPSGSSGSAPHLSARSGKWTPFHFEMVRRAPIPKEEIRNVRGRYRNVTEERDTVLRYGSIVRLVDEQSGIRSEPVRLVRVDKNEVLVGEDTGHPVSELHRIGLVRVNNANRRMYLSAPSARTGGAELLQAGMTPIPPAQPTPTAPVDLEKVEDPSTEPDTLGAAPTGEPMPEGETPTQPMQSAEGDTSEAVEPPTKKRRTKRHALVAAIAEEEQEGSQLAMLQWASATSFLADREFKGGKKNTIVRQVTVDRVEDWMCWIIGSVGHTTYSFFSVDPSRPLPVDTTMDSAPYLLDTAKYNAEDHSLDLVLPDQAFFSFSDPARPRSADLYLGTMGPLHATYWRSASVPNKLPVEGVAPGVEASPDNGAPCLPYDPLMSSDMRGRQARSAFPAGPGHVIVKLDLPPLEAIQAMVSAHPPAPSAEMATTSAIEQEGITSDARASGDALDSLAGSAGPADSHVDDLARALLAVQDDGNDIPGFMEVDQSLAHGPIDPALAAMDEAARAEALQSADPSTNTADTELDRTGESSSLVGEPSGSFGETKAESTRQVVPSQAQILDRDVWVIRPVAGEQSRSATEKALPIILVRGTDGMCFDLDVGIGIEIVDGQTRVEVCSSA